MKYPYDKGFRKSMVNIPFSGFLCRLTQKPMERMLKRVKIPEGITVCDYFIPGYNGEKIRVKELVPEASGDAAILVLHGGGFGYKTAPYQLHNACRYAMELQCRVYLPDYHLLPEYPFPAAYEDAMTTYRYMVNHSAELGIHRDKIIVLGDSAGGALAANVCNMARENGLPTPCGQVLIYPVIDNAMVTESMKQFLDTPMWNAKNNQRMWDMYLKNATMEEITVAVPMKNQLPDYLPPTYIEITEFDCLRDEAMAYAERIRPVAASVEVNETKGTVHGYDTVTEHPIAKESVEKRIGFMKMVVTLAKK